MITTSYALNTLSFADRAFSPPGPPGKKAGKTLSFFSRSLIPTGISSVHVEKMENKARISFCLLFIHLIATFVEERRNHEKQIHLFIACRHVTVPASTSAGFQPKVKLGNEVLLSKYRHLWKGKSGSGNEPNRH